MQQPVALERVEDLKGRTVAEAVYLYDSIALLCTDGTVLSVSVSGDEDFYSLRTAPPSPEDLRELGLMSQEEYEQYVAELTEKRYQEQLEYRRQHYLELKAEFEPTPVLGFKVDVVLAPGVDPDDPRVMTSFDARIAFAEGRNQGCGGTFVSFYVTNDDGTSCTERDCDEWYTFLLADLIVESVDVKPLSDANGPW